MELFQEMPTNSGATFSECRKHRYLLYRKWSDSKPMLMFIGLNPSTANESEQDPTITRVINFAKGWGYGGIYMLNLFSQVTPKPSELDLSAQMLAENDLYLKRYSGLVSDVLCCWGAFKEAKDRAQYVIDNLLDSNLICLGINNDGSPKHPLYINSKTSQINYR